MNWDRTEGSWKQLADTVKRRWDKLIDGQRGLWAGKRERPKPVEHRRARQQEADPQ